MDAVGHASNWRLPERVDVLYDSERTRVTRLWMPGGPVIRKERLGQDRDKRLRNEFAVLERLAGVEGVPQLADSPAYPGSIMLVDVDGARLDHRATPIEIDELLDLGLALADVVATMHRRGVVHRNVHPGNVLLHPPRGTPYLMGFGMATTFAEVRPEFTHPNEIIGSLPYLAPEQTGRTARAVDQRADLYGLGATLYELATGEPPFGTGDPLRLSHDHLARVPVAPAMVSHTVPAGLSDVIMHMLEKEPDNRYQTAEGLIHDLAELKDRRDDVSTLSQVGTHDFPLRLLPPSRIVGRDSEIASLEEALSAALNGRCHGVIVSGAPGVGKTSLINELRPIVTARNGWFVAGKFDQYRRDQEFDATWQAMHSLGRLLLAEPEEAVADVRARMLQAVGPYAGLLAAVHPSFAALLDVAPDPTTTDTGDPLQQQARLQALTVELLRIVVSPERPLVFVVDDLQWAGRTPLGLVDMVINDDDLEGLLLVGAYREDEVDPTHPLTTMLSRWARPGTGPKRLRLENLPESSLAALLADVLRVDADNAAELANTIAPRTQGNPYDTVELLNSLRREGVLVPGDDGWRWDAAALRRTVSRTDVADLLSERADAMPAATRDMLNTMACLGGRVELSLLQAATGLPTAAVEQHLVPALDDGLLVIEPGIPDAIRFRHDRVQETLLRRLGRGRLRALRLRLARQLAKEPRLFAVAAEQYLPVLDAAREPDERRAVAALLRRTAEQAKLVSNYALVERCLSAAGTLMDATDTATMIELHTGRLEALYSLGRLDDGDEVYRELDRLCTKPLDRAPGTLVQVSSLANRRRPKQAVGLGLELLRQFGSAVPSRETLDIEIERGLDAVYRWVEEVEDAHRPDVTDPTLIATAALINRMIPPAWNSDQSMFAWLVIEAVRIWAQHGPARTLMGPVSHVALVTIAQRQDYRTGWLALQRILAMSEDRNYEPDASQARFLYVLSTGHWFEPLEVNVPRAALTRERLLQGGDLQNACFTYIPVMHQLIEYAPSLDSYVEEVESGQAFARRTGNDLAADMIRGFRSLVRVLRGEGGGSIVDEIASFGTDAGYPPAIVMVHITRALGAAVLGDSKQLAQHTAALMPLLANLDGMYLTVPAHVLRALAVARQVRSASADERGPLLAELDSAIDWLALRAADAPMNFLHLLRLAEAERAWAIDDFRAAAYAFDVAQREAAARQRPWHRALILEHAARFYLDHSMDHAGYALLAAARREYLSWGATAKVNQLDWAYPTLQTRRNSQASADGDEPGDLMVGPSATVTGAIDLLGILAASQALSSATSIDGLRDQVVEVLSAMTGATLVHLLVWNRDEQNWLLSTAGDGDDGGLPVGEAGRKGLLPLSVVRYAERTREPLVLNDATRDERFARDPYFANLDRCSMLVVPILNRGSPQALLLLENRLIRGAFSTERLDGVMLIAAQLAVSLDNAEVYASLERKVAKRTEALALANKRLELLSITDPLTGLANRRRFADVLNAEWRRSRRTGAPISLAIADVDHFKPYNDRYGHVAGDACLQRIAMQLKGHTRDIDLIVRYGGEEFAIVMAGTPIDTALEVAERLRAAVAALAEPHTTVADQIVTVSIGVASITPTPLNAQAHLIEAADVELYKAKRGGRNQVSGTSADEQG